MFPLTITLHNSAQLSAVLAALQGGDVQKMDTIAAPAAEAPKRAKKAAPAAEPAPAAEAPAAEAPALAAAPAAPALEYAPVGAAIVAYAAKHGREAALEKLSAFGVKTGKELKPEQFADALAAFLEG